MIKKTCMLAVIVAFFALSAFGQQFFMSDYHAGKVAVFRAVDADCPMYIWHDGSDQDDGTAVTAATCSVVVDDSVFLLVNGVKDSTLHTDGSLGIAAGEEADSCGKLANLINASKGWHCQLVDALRNDLSTHLSAKALTDCYKTETPLHRDNSDTKQMGAGITRHGYGQEDLSGYIVFLEGFHTATVEATNDSDHTVEVWICNDKTRIDTKVWSRQPLVLDGIPFQWPTYGTTGLPLFATKPGERIIVRVLCADATEPGANSYIGVIGSIVRGY